MSVYLCVAYLFVLSGRFIPTTPRGAIMWQRQRHVVADYTIAGKATLLASLYVRNYKSEI